MLKNLNQILHDWLEFLAINQNFSKHTVESYGRDLQNFLNFCSEYYNGEFNTPNLIDVDSKTVRSWLAWRIKKGYSYSSNNRALSCIKTFFRFLLTNLNIPVKTLNNIASAKKVALLNKSLNEAEAKIAIENIGDFNTEDWLSLRDEAFLLLLYCSGLRISEALSITIKDLDDDYIKILGKGNKERLVPWLGIAKDIIKKYLALAPFKFDRDAVIFIGAKGKPLKAPVFSKQLRKVRASFGLKQNTTPHSFRHSFATHLLEHGADLKSIQELLGHASLSTTQRYTKVNVAHLKNIYAKAHPLE
ncbi:MAG: tyrosine recombinase XerC [Rickettsiaceae bacterium]|nr:tyrosine recombinase XerC [Rickettsiaceae bacterium]